MLRFYGGGWGWGWRFVKEFLYRLTLTGEVQELLAESIVSPFGLVLDLALLRAETSQVRVRRLDHRVEAVRVALRAVAALQPSGQDLNGSCEAFLALKVNKIISYLTTDE